jgi:hypothetical protein
MSSQHTVTTRILNRDMDEFKKGYQPRTDFVKDVKRDLLADSHTILNSWNNYFFQLFNAHGG